MNRLFKRNSLLLKSAINKFENENGLDNLAFLSTKKAYK